MKVVRGTSGVSLTFANSPDYVLQMYDMYLS